VLSGISISGNKFSYENPLASQGSQRDAWIGLACCPANLTRIIPQVGGFAYACGQRRVYVNLYAAGEASLKMDDGRTVKLAQQTEYPWNGRVRISVTPAETSEFTVCLRIPGWAQGRPVPSDLYRVGNPNVPAIGLKVNGKKTDPKADADGYVHVQGRWKAGDVVELDLPMPVQRVYAHESVQADQGRVALMRGPIVYCLEAVDHPSVDLSRLALPREAELRAVHRPGLLGGVTVLQGQALVEGQRPATLTAVPYYSWQNREEGAMLVWLKGD
jgi:hypothetical protein